MKTKAHNTKLLRKKLAELHIHMYEIAQFMDMFGDEETQKHGLELLGASKICKEWAEHAKARV